MEDKGCLFKDSGAAVLKGNKEAILVQLDHHLEADSQPTEAGGQNRPEPCDHATTNQLAGSETTQLLP